MTYITAKNILKHKVQLHVDYDGLWSAQVETDEGMGILASRCTTMKQAERMARLELKKTQTRVAVPFTHLVNSDGTTKLCRAIARGRHALHSHILIWIDDGPDGRNDTIRTRYWSSTDVLKPDIPKKDLDKIKSYFAYRDRAKEQLAKVNSLIQKWEADHSFDLAKAVDAAIADAEAPTESSPQTTQEQDNPPGTPLDHITP